MEAKVSRPDLNDPPLVDVRHLDVTFGRQPVLRDINLRVPRNELTDAVLQSPAPTAGQVEKAREARATFGKWHGISLLVNFAALGLALLGTVLAAHLPPSRSG